MDFTNVFHIFALSKKKMAHSTSGLGHKTFNLVGVYKASQGFESPMRYKTNTKKKKVGLDEWFMSQASQACLRVKS